MRRLVILAAALAAGCAGHPAARKSTDSTAAAAPRISGTRTTFVARGTSDGKPWTIEVFEDGIRLTDAPKPAVVFPPGRVDGNVRRAIDFHEGDVVDEAAFKALVREAVALNVAAKDGKKR